MNITPAMRKAAQDFGRLGGLKSRNQKEAAARSHTRAAEAKRRATRARNHSVKVRTTNGVDTATGR